MPTRKPITDDEKRARVLASRAAYTARWREANPERNTAAVTRWHAENRERVREYHRKHFIQNREVYREKRKAQYAANREAALRDARQWVIDNPERARETSRAWHENNPEKVRANSERRRSRKAGNFSAEDISRMMDSQESACANPTCGQSLTHGYHIDHILPLARGGTCWPDNLQLLCPKCNLKKGSKDPYVWAQENGRLFV